MSEGATENENPEALQDVQEEPASEPNESTEVDAADSAPQNDESQVTSDETEEAPVVEDGEASPPADGDPQAESPAENEQSAVDVEGEVPPVAEEGESDPTETTEKAIESPAAEGEALTEEAQTEVDGTTAEEDVEQSVEKFSEEGGPLIEPITEDLPEEETPRDDDNEEDVSVEHPDPSGTPPPAETIDIIHEEAEEDADEDDISLVEETPVYDRQALLDKYKEAIDLRSKIQTQNMQMQHKLAEYFRKKKTDERGQEMEKNVTDQEQRYLKYMSNLEELQNEEDRKSVV